MSAPRFHLDENVDPAVAEGLRRRAIDATTARERRLLHATDEEQLRAAASEGRVLVSHDVRTLPSLHAAWLAQGREHAGIILAPVRPVGDLVRALAALWNETNAADLRSRLVWLSRWLRQRP